MSDEDDNRDDDFTSLEDLGEYLHELDKETESILSERDPDHKTANLDELEDDDSEEAPPPFDNDEADAFSSSDDDQAEFGPTDEDQAETNEEEGSFASDDEFADSDDFSENAQEDEDDSTPPPPFESESESEADSFESDSDNDGFTDNDDDFNNDEQDDAFGSSNDDPFGEDDSEDEFEVNDDFEDGQAEQEEDTEALLGASEDEEAQAAQEQAQQDADNFAADGDEGLSDDEFSSETDSEDEFESNDEGTDGFAQEDESLEETGPEETTNDFGGGAPNVMEAPEKTPLPHASTSDSSHTPVKAAGKREDFSDLRKFGESITYGAVNQGGNPPFSVILRGIRYQEDADEIFQILEEHSLVTPESEDDIRKGLEQGSVLISQISEFSAIYLAHRFRKFDIDILMGLSDELHPSKSYQRDFVGLVSKDNIRQNKVEYMDVDKIPVKVEDILMSTTPGLEGYRIHRYSGLATEHAIIDEDELERLHYKYLERKEKHGLHRDFEEFSQEFQEFLSEDAAYSLGLNEVYRELADELRTQAFQMGGNAVVNINYQLTPLVPSKEKGEGRYKITCSGSVVWVSALPSRGE